MNNFSYKSEQVHSFFKNGKGHTRRNLVEIQGGKGIKAVETYDAKGDQLSRKQKALTASELACIQRNKFIPGLFKDCIRPLNPRSKRSKTRRTRK